MLWHALAVERPRAMRAYPVAHLYCGSGICMSRQHLCRGTHVYHGAMASEPLHTYTDK